MAGPGDMSQRLADADEQTPSGGLGDALRRLAEVFAKPAPASNERPPEPKEEK